MRPLSLCLLAIAVAGCGSTKVVHETRVATRTVVTTTTVAATVTAKTTVVESRPAVYVEMCCGFGLQYKPTQMSYYGGHQLIRRLRWITYGGATAVGNGEFGRDDCNPDCAQGHYTWTPVTVTLSTREFCNGATAYRDWTITGVNLGPDVYQPASITGTGCRS